MLELGKGLDSFFPP